MSNKVAEKKKRGFIHRYNVERVDGKQVTDAVVLELKDKNARQGVKAFSHAVRLDGYEKLANELDQLIISYEDMK